MPRGLQAVSPLLDDIQPIACVPMRLVVLAPASHVVYSNARANDEQCIPL